MDGDDFDRDRRERDWWFDMVVPVVLLAFLSLLAILSVMLWPKLWVWLLLDLRR